MSATARPDAGPLAVPTAPETALVELPGGARGALVARPTVPMVQLRLRIPLPGALLERPAPAMVLGESLLAGAGDKDRATLAAAIEALGGQLSAGVSDDGLAIGGSCLAEHLPAFLGLLCEILVGATYPDAAVVADRHRLAEEIVLAQSQPDVLADEALRRQLYPRHPYGAPLPRPSALRRVSARAVRELHRSLVSPGRAVLVLAGAVETGSAEQMVLDQLGPWLSRPAPGGPPLPMPLPPHAGPLRFHDRPGAVQTNLRLARRAPRRDSPEWPAAALANLAFGGMFSSRLVDSLRERLGYTYSPRSSVSHASVASQFSITLDVGTEVTAPALVALRHELGRAVALGFDEAEVEGARRYALGTLAFALSTQAGVASQLASLLSTGSEPDHLSRHAAGLAAATREEVNRAARTLLSPVGLTAVALGDASAAFDALAAVEAAELV